MPKKQNKLTDFKVQKKNANKHTKRGMDLLNQSISKDGWIGAMTAAADGEIFDGSARLETVNDVMPSDPIVVESDGSRPIIIKRTDIKKASDSKAVRLALEANRIQELDLNWDTDVLGEIYEKKKSLIEGLFNDVELKKLGIEILEPPDAPEPQIDRAAELLKKWKVKTGDLFQIGEHRLICGDCTDAAVVARVMDGELARMVFEDPPYNVAYQDNESVESLKKRNRRTDGLVIQNDSMTDEEFDLFLDSFLEKLPIDKGGVFSLCAPAGRTETQFRNALDRVSGLTLRECIVWVKDVFVFGRQDYQWRHESILYGWKDGAAHYFIDDHTQDTVWEIDRPKVSKEHPTMKPVELPMKAISNSSQMNEIVFDGFVGSGSTLVACEILKRRGRASEKDPKFVAVTLQRLADMGLKPKRIK